MIYRGEPPSSNKCTCQRLPDSNLLSGLLYSDCPEHSSVVADAWEVYRYKKVRKTLPETA